MSNKLPKKNTEKVTEIQPNSNEGVVAHHESKHYRGPIPEPLDLQKYEDIKIGFAERIITMAENEASHRQNIEHKIINSERVFTILGQMTALSMGLLVVALMAYTVSQGFAEEVQWLGVSIASVIGLFIYKRK
ncbi:hypothetical protein MNB_SUP05-SYMBIONT-5-1068 [hydrothermal vent metagenome]|uniref:DUF2335 domain-containing protein n=1 Tax=hydrothermal vent metagenome TaxID=652676 RepID=A0A1W1E1F0_9ZZZZ